MKTTRPIKPLTYTQARKALKKLCPNRYHSVRIEHIVYHSGEVKQICALYVDPAILVEADTFEEAFALLANKGIK